MSLARYLTKHVVIHTTQLGWGEIANGALLKIAEANGFQLIITSDKNIPLQQNLAECNMAQLQLSTNNWPLMISHIPAIVDAVNETKAGEFRKVFCGRFVPRKSRR
jgi:hypothetical protein